MTWFNYMQAIQKQENPEGDLGRALLRVTQLEAEVARLNENVNKLNKALEQSLELMHSIGGSIRSDGGSVVMVVFMGRAYGVHIPAPELAAWLKENK